MAISNLNSTLDPNFHEFGTKHERRLTLVKPTPEPNPSLSSKVMDVCKHPITKLAIAVTVTYGANKLAQRSGNPAHKAAVLLGSAAWNIYSLANNYQHGRKLLQHYHNVEEPPAVTDPTPSPNPGLRSQAAKFWNHPVTQVTWVASTTGWIIYGLYKNYQDACKLMQRFSDDQRNRSNSER